MAPILEIIMPARSPGAVLMQTIDSLLAQTDRGFGVLLSDNFSSKGLEFFDLGAKQLASAGIAVRRVKPPFELGRVEHWNWAHAQGEGEWLKPLFVGDLLKPDYVEQILKRIQAPTPADIIRCEFEAASPARTVISQAPSTQAFLTPAEFVEQYLAHGNWLGGPINVCCRRTAWRAAGGYSVQLPACADVNLYFRLALGRGLETIPECLATFQLHDQRFSHGITKRRVNGCFEIWLMLRQARNFCLAAGIPWPRFGVSRGVWKQLKVDYWEPRKRGVKALWRGTS